VWRLVDVVLAIAGVPEDGRAHPRRGAGHAPRLCRARAGRAHRVGHLGRTIEEIDLERLLDENPIAIHSSEYIRQIEAYLEYFDREQMLVLLQKDLRDDPHGTLSKIFAHVGVDPSFRITLEPPKNATSDFLDGAKDERLTARLRRLPGYETIRGLVPTAVKDRIKKIARSFVPAQAELSFTPATRARLHEHFRPFNAELADYLGRDLSSWDR
jgi:hypothetical protein